MDLMPLVGIVMLCFIALFVEILVKLGQIEKLLLEMKTKGAGE